MADEPNKRMDEMLRGYAAKRRDLPEVSPHPATRRMLQEEVRQVYGARGQDRKARAGWLAWWPQIAFGCALFLVIGLTAAVLQNASRTEKQLAQAETAETAKEQRAQAETAPLMKKELAQTQTDAVAESDAPVLLEREVTLAPPRPTETLALSTPREESLERQRSVPRSLALADQAPAPVQQKSAEQLESNLSFLATAPPADLRIASATAGKAVEAAPAAAAVLRPELGLRANDLTNLGAALRTRFVQTNIAAGPVLRSFQVEELGEQVRFVDFDGSVYSGLKQPARATQSEPTTLYFRELASNASVFSFQAAGTNVTLGRLVTLEGQYFDRTNLPIVTSVRATNVARARAAARRVETPARGVIVGNAMIGGSNQMPVRAISVDR